MNWAGYNLGATSPQEVGDKYRWGETMTRDEYTYENYDFYNPKNIYIYDSEFDFTDEFFTYEYQELPEEIYQKYSLRGFLKQIFEIKD